MARPVVGVVIVTVPIGEPTAESGSSAFLVSMSQTTDQPAADCFMTWRTARHVSPCRGIHGP